MQPSLTVARASQSDVKSGQVAVAAGLATALHLESTAAWPFTTQITTWRVVPVPSAQPSLGHVFSKTTVLEQSVPDPNSTLSWAALSGVRQCHAGFALQPVLLEHFCEFAGGGDTTEHGDVLIFSRL